MLVQKKDGRLHSMDTTNKN